MSCPFGSNTPQLTHLTQVKKITGKTPPQLAAYENSSVPESLEYIYKLYLDFYNGERFSYTEFISWQKYLDIKLDYRESELIRQICLEHYAYLAERQAKYAEWEKAKKPKGK